MVQIPSLLARARRARPLALACALALGPLAACGTDEGGGGSGGGGGGGGDGGDRGGPHSLLGFEWTSEPVVVNGIEFVLRFSFDADSVTAHNTCDGDLTATAEAPVRYTYTATVPAGDSEEVDDGGDTCFVEVRSGSFDFEIVDDQLVFRQNGETGSFEPAGSVAGLYGEWTAETDFGSLTWSMGGGAITATADCDNGLSATVVVDADFENRLEFTEAAEETVVDDFGSECTITIAEAMATYEFDGDTLVVDFEGEEIRFEPRS